jgi:hypothetical protein
MPNQTNSELGRELKVSELVEGTVIVLGREDRNAMYTAWVYAIMHSAVAFRAGELQMLMIAARDLDDRDKLTDDTGKRILVFEYLGEI